MNKIIYAFIIIILLNACSAKPTMMPAWRQEMAQQGPEGASYIFKEGWRDGCESGSTTSATQLQKLYYGFKMNETLIENDEYYNAWNKAFKYCHRYLYQYHRKGISD